MQLVNTNEIGPNLKHCSLGKVLPITSPGLSLCEKTQFVSRRKVDTMPINSSLPRSAPSEAVNVRLMWHSACNKD